MSKIRKNDIRRIQLSYKEQFNYFATKFIKHSDSQPHVKLEYTDRMVEIVEAIADVTNVTGVKPKKHTLFEKTDVLEMLVCLNNLSNYWMNTFNSHDDSQPDVKATYSRGMIKISKALGNLSSATGIKIRR